MNYFSLFANKFGDTVKDFGAEVVKHSPHILTGLGVGGIFATAGLSYKVRPKVDAILEEHEKIVADIYKNCKNDDTIKRRLKEEKWRLFKELAKVVGPIFAMAIASSACVIGADCINSHRIAVFSAAYAVAEKKIANMDEYKDKVRDIVGNKKADYIDKVHDETDILHPTKSANVYETGLGHMLCYIDFEDKYIRINPGKLRQVEKDLNYRLLSEHWISVNEFFDIINVTHSAAGDVLGWDLDELGEIRFTISTRMAEVDGIEEPCTVLGFDFCQRRNTW